MAKPTLVLTRKSKPTMMLTPKESLQNTMPAKSLPPLLEMMKKATVPATEAPYTA